jgi:dihydrofolate reductase
MQNLVLKMSMSLDGFVAGPNGELDWIFGGFDDQTAAWQVENVRHASAHLMGSRTFRDMAAFWPYSTDAVATPMNAIPKIVFSRSGAATTTRGLEDARRATGAGEAPPDAAAKAAEWARSRVENGDLADAIAKLRREPGRELLAHGGASFARALVRLDLVDEYRLLIHPIALGRGQALFAELPASRGLPLASVTAFPAGAVAHVYRRA